MSSKILIRVLDTVLNALKVTTAGNMVRQTQVDVDKSVTFANSAPANTQAAAITITRPANPVKEHELIVYNPSTITDLTVKLFAVETNLGGGSRDVLIATVIIPKKQTTTGTNIEAHAKFATGLFNGADLKIQVSNDTVLGVADGFTANLRLREVG